MMIKNTFYLVRHGQTRWNEEGRFQGRSDTALSPEGRMQALENARRLRGHLEARSVSPEAIEVMSSPLSRCLETMRIIADELGVPASARSIEPRLMEAGFGRWEGLTTYEVKQRFPEERRRRKTDRWRFAPLGGTSHAEMAEGMRTLLDELRPRGEVLIVSHSGNLRVMFAMLQGVAEEEAMRIAVPHDRVFVCRQGQVSAL